MAVIKDQKRTSVFALLAFDEVITTAVTTSDFEVLGTANASVDSISHTAGNVLEVTTTAAATGTMTLDVKASASFSDIVGRMPGRRRMCGLCQPRGPIVSILAMGEAAR